MRERKACEGVMPLRPVLGFCSPRARSWRTCSTSGAWSSRNPTIPCRRGSRWTPWFRNSRSAKLSWGSAIRVMLSSAGADGTAGAMADAAVEQGAAQDLGGGGQGGGQLGAGFGDGYVFHAYE